MGRCLLTSLEPSCREQAARITMKVGGWRTRNVFECFAIVSQTDIADALKKLAASQPEIGRYCCGFAKSSNPIRM